MKQEYITIVGMAFSFLLTYILLKTLRSQLIYLGLVFLSMFLILIEEFIWQTSLIKTLPYFANSLSPSVFFIPPLLYLYIKDFNITSKPKILLIFIIPVSAYLNFIPLYLENFNYKYNYVQYELNNIYFQKFYETVIHGPTFISEDIFDIFLILQFIVYTFLIFRQIPITISNKQNKFKDLYANWGNYFQFVLIGTVIYIIAKMYILPEEYSFSTLFLTTISIVITFLFLKSSTLLKDNYKSTSYNIIPKENKSEIYDQLVIFLNKKEVCSLDNLTIEFVAKEMEISSNKLSYLINEKDTTFRELVNKSRINNIVEFLNTKESSIYSIEGIAKKYGYKSKSTFYINFKKEMNMTPKEYLNK